MLKINLKEKENIYIFQHNQIFAAFLSKPSWPEPRKK
jgi:hypothetical protein